MLGTGTGTTSSDGQSSSVAASGNLSRHEARVRAAASAASIYGRSFVYPSSENTLVWYVAMSYWPVYISCFSFSFVIIHYMMVEKQLTLRLDI